MVLTYYQGKNFGDAINPMVFNYLLPDFFDSDDTELFLGIGSILGFKKGDQNTKKLIVFSSGYAYDEAPVIDKRYDIRCVRGPLTASVLKVDKSLAVTDGALLLRQLPQFSAPVNKKYRFSYIPHYKSELMFDRWKQVFGALGVNYISPAADPVEVIQQIRQSECVMAEAMHGAIIADYFRVPWIPIKMFEHINSFKWQDWLLSMELKDYYPSRLQRIYNLDNIYWIIKDKLGFRQNTIRNRLASNIYRSYQSYRLEKVFISKVAQIMRVEPTLSKTSVLESKENQFMDLLVKLRRDYNLIV